MDLFYTDEENRFRAELASFLEAELAPIAQRIEESDEPPFDFLQKLAARGAFGVLHGKDVGGSARGLIYNHIISEEICYYSAATDITRAVSTAYYGVPLNHWGTAEQKRKFLAPIVSGEKYGSIAITEPRGGSDAAGMHTTAVRKGDRWVINGEKTWITNSSFASFVCVFAITDPTVHGHLGMTAFIVETSNPGFKIVKSLQGMGVRGSTHCLIAFEDCEVPEDHVIGEVNNGWAVLMDELQSERIDIASRGLGCGRRAFTEAVRYSAAREQFKHKLRHFEAMSFRVADMQVGLDAARLLIIKACRMYDAGHRIDKEAAEAKLFASEISFKIADAALQIHGASGYSKDGVIERLFRDSRVYGFGGGSSEIMRFLIQREVYKEFGLIQEPR